MTPQFSLHIAIRLVLAAMVVLLVVPVPRAQAPEQAAPAVKLVLLIAVDQFRADYLTRFGPPTGGLRMLTTGGAVFTDAHLEHAQTVTAVGHATMLTGATPAVSGIIGNSWYERSTRRTVESITDDTEVRDMTRQTDRQIQELLSEVDRLVGLSQTLIAFTTDHGVASLPEVLSTHRVPAGRFSSQDLADGIERALDARFGDAVWIERVTGSFVYLDHAVIAGKGADPAAVGQVAADAAGLVPHVARAYTSDALLQGGTPDDRLSRRVARTHHASRSGDLYVVLEPHWISAASGATHGSPYAYDAHIPLIVMGPGVRPGRYGDHAALNDLAPTLATVLGIQFPSGAEGRVLAEALLEPMAATGRTTQSTP